VDIGGFLWWPGFESHWRGRCARRQGQQGRP
jgi:hypothetical protein